MRKFLQKQILSDKNLFNQLLLINLAVVKIFVFFTYFTTKETSEDNTIVAKNEFKKFISFYCITHIFPLIKRNEKQVTILTHT